MREILFRAKRIDNGNWVYGDLRDYNEYVKIVEQNIPLRCIPYDYIVDKETVGQYTGLQDSKGNKIFEGDIIEYYNWKGKQIGEVKHRNCCFYLDEYRIGGFDNKKVEVIGNIYDNPNLIGESK